MGIHMLKVVTYVKDNTAKAIKEIIENFLKTEDTHIYDLMEAFEPEVTTQLAEKYGITEEQVRDLWLRFDSGLLEHFEEFIQEVLGE